MKNIIRESQLLRLAFALSLTVATGLESVGSFQVQQAPEVVITPETQVDYGVDVAIGTNQETLRRVDVYMSEGYVITMANFEKSKNGQIQITVSLAIEESGGQHITEPVVVDTAIVDSETFIVLIVSPPEMRGTVRYVIPILPFLEEPIEQTGSGNDG